MSWFWLTLIAAVFLGLYDIAKKNAVAQNAVPPVLLGNVCTAALIWGIPVLAAFANFDMGIEAKWQATLTDLEVEDHLLLFAKSAMVGSSWAFAFFALKHLPISIAAPIRATSPFWTILLAVAFLSERPNQLQWSGIVLILMAFVAFSRVGEREGIRFHRNRWIAFMVIATLISAFCGIYDKFLLQTKGYSAATVQAWFSIYLVPVMFPMFLYWWKYDRGKSPFEWRWSIPLIAIFLLLADYCYFVAVSQPDALIAVISPLRRTSIIIAFAYGIFGLKEVNWRAKLVCIAILFAGVCLISLA